MRAMGYFYFHLITNLIAALQSSCQNLREKLFRLWRSRAPNNNRRMKRGKSQKRTEPWHIHMWEALHTKETTNRIIEGKMEDYYICSLEGSRNKTSDRMRKRRKGRLRSGKVRWAPVMLLKKKKKNWHQHAPRQNYPRERQHPFMLTLLFLCLWRCRPLRVKLKAKTWQQKAFWFLAVRIPIECERLYSSPGHNNPAASNSLQAVLQNTYFLRHVGHYRRWLVPPVGQPSELSAEGSYASDKNRLHQKLVTLWPAESFSWWLA